MSIYTKLPLQDSRKEGEKILKVAVSNVPVNPSVVITISSRIYFFNESGEKLPYELTRIITPTCVEWHPTKATLAIGWENGNVTLFDEERRTPKEESRPHDNPIVMIRFNPSGTRMVTSDFIGLVAVWRGITLLSVYSKDSAVYHCIFCDLRLQNFKSSPGMFLFGCINGVVCLADDLNHCNDVCKVGGSVKALMFYQKQNSVIIITSTLLLVQFKLSTTERSAPDRKMKFSIAGEPQNLSSIWIGGCLLATCSNENMIRMWHVESDEKYILSVFDVVQNQQTNFASDKINTIAYNRRGRSLVAGTRQGRLLFWKNSLVGSQSPQEKEMWNCQPSLNLGKPISNLTVGKNNGLIVCKQSDGEVVIVSETKVIAKMSSSIKVITKETGIEILAIANRQAAFQAAEGLKGVDVRDDLIVYWTNKKIELLRVYVKDSLVIERKASLKSKVSSCGLVDGDTLVVTTDHGYKLLSASGAQKMTKSFPESEGRVIGFQITGSQAVFWSSHSYIKVVDISKKDKIVLTKKFEDSKGSLGVVRSCLLNSDGSKVAILSDKEGVVQNRFYVLDVESLTFQSYDLGPTKIPIQLFWDLQDKRYLGLQTEYAKKEWVVQGKDNAKKEEEDPNEAKTAGRDLMTFFVTSQAGIRLQQRYVLNSKVERVFAISIPYIHVIERSNQGGKLKYVTNEIVMNDFQGLDVRDVVLRQAILNFSFYLTTGNLDEAYRSVKSIQNPFVWEKMAVMSVKSKRLDVAQICIGNMRFARGAKAIRQAKKQPQLQAQLAMVAIQLNLPGQAAELYQSVKRYDLLNKMYIAQGDVDKSIEVSQKMNRISLKHSYYCAAKYYEANDPFPRKAVSYYQKAGLGTRQVPRMLLQKGLREQLQSYVRDHKDKQLQVWYGQLLQSQGDIQNAIGYYRNASSTQNIVRILISTGDVNRAINECRTSPEPKAHFLIANYFEKQNNNLQAIRFYASAQYYSQAMRIAMADGLDDEIMTLSKDAPNEVVARAAGYFHRKGKTEKAIRLFRAAKYYKRALDIALKNNLTEVARDINKEIQSEEGSGQGLTAQSMNEVINRLLQQGKGDKALPLLMASKQYQNAMQVCMKYNLAMSDQLVTHIVESDPQNTELIKKLAEKCKSQGSFDMASKLYLRLGDKAKSMKCLIQEGNKDKIIAFANTARSSEMYVLAANFLQGSDWIKDTSLMKTITGFYHKAKAFDLLANFFESCSLIQIDEYRDYAKGLQALKQALKHATTANQADKKSAIQQKMALVQKFISLQNLFESKPSEMLQGLNSLLQLPNVNNAVRVGDIFSMMIQHYFQAKNYQECLSLMKKMRDRGVSVKQYVSEEIVAEVTKALNNGRRAAPRKQAQDQQIIQEDIRN